MAKNITVIPASQIQKSKATEKKKIRVAAYCRVSTEHEEQVGSFKNQVEYYTELINRNPDWEMAGIFADEGISGTGTRKRAGFNAMIKACRDGKVDRVITKSISRFARNTADCLRFSRELRDRGIPIFFEKENIDTMAASGELLFTILSSLAQEESRNISENTAWGIRSRFKQGIPQINTNHFMGYDKDKDGNLIINEEQAAVVKRIYREFLEGWNLAEIARHLNDEEIPGVTGKACWTSITIKRMLRNEKYKGDLLMQKYYTKNFLTKMRVENDGALDQYYIKQAHKAIVTEEEWEAAQYELERRYNFRKSHGLKEISSLTKTGFFAKVFCGDCGGRFARKDYKGIKEPFWKCVSAEKQSGKTCSMGNVKESDLRHAFTIAWNDIVQHREKNMSRWDKLEASDNALDRIRGHQMKELTEQGELEFEIPELTRMVLKEVIVKDPKTFTIKFLDGELKNICL
jgi:DNA invertase Pin-like site-specific DNA recombinase